ncbi:hypothetical protein GGR52DRAFT_566429 [Hypoxylon sp. FL1284]|nr:hypothetical protein GGR52DRAFT_566429 [Hypoxylon sp. FL1284]
MAQPAQYGSLGPVQQYNQISFSPIPPPPPPRQQQQSPHPHPQPHPQHQLQHHPPQQAPPASAAPTAFQQQHPQTLLSQQQNALALAAPAPALPSSSSPTVAATAPPDETGSPAEPQPKRRRVGRPPKLPAVREYQARIAREAAASGQPPPPRPSPRAAPPPHALVKGPYASSADATFALQLHVFTSGHGLSQKRTVKEKLASGRYDPEGSVIRRDFACERGGSDFVSQGTGERRRESRKCGCPWKAVARQLKREGSMWFVEVLDEQHNHPATPPDRMHTVPSYRRWQRDNNAGIRDAIARLARAAAMPARQVAAYLKGDYADPDLDRLDRHILRALSMGDAETPGAGAGAVTSAADADADGAASDRSATIFDIIARRPTLVLQENLAQ